MCVHTINTAQIIELRFTRKMYNYVLVTCELLRHKPCFTTAKDMCYNGPGHILVTRMMFSDETLQSYNLMLECFQCTFPIVSVLYITLIRYLSQINKTTILLYSVHCNLTYNKNNEQRNSKKSSL